MRNTLPMMLTLATLHLSVSATSSIGEKPTETHSMLALVDDQALSGMYGSVGGEPGAVNGTNYALLAVSPDAETSSQRLLQVLTTSDLVAEPASEDTKD